MRVRVHISHNQSCAQERDRQARFCTCRKSLSLTAFPGDILQRPSLWAARAAQGEFHESKWRSPEAPADGHRRSGTGPSAVPWRFFPKQSLEGLGPASP